MKTESGVSSKQTEHSVSRDVAMKTFRALVGVIDVVVVLVVDVVSTIFPPVRCSNKCPQMRLAKSAFQKNHLSQKETRIEMHQQP
jgi:hypothetical protein